MQDPLSDSTWAIAWRHFERLLEDRGSSPRTLRAYRDTQQLLLAFLGRIGLRTDDPSVVTPEHVREFLRWLREGDEERGVHPHSAVSLRSRRAWLSPFFTWLTKEGEVRENPVARVEVPFTPLRIQRSPKPDLVERLLKSPLCNQDTKAGARNYALIICLYDTGARRSEVVQIDIDPGARYDCIAIIGKGNKEREISLGSSARQAVLRYIRKARLTSGPLFRGRANGRLTGEGVFQVVQEVGRSVGERVSPHDLRRAFAAVAMKAGVPRDYIKDYAGWDSDEMLEHYAREGRAERARTAHKAYSPADRLFGERGK